MLDRTHRMRGAGSFSTTIREGRRAGTPTLVLHLDLAGTRSGAAASAPQVGLVTGRKVGNAVSRNLVRRRVRHLMRSRLADLPSGARLVIRALPGSAEASSAALAVDLDRGLTRLLGPELRGGER